jgi:glycosyltransferase involved in cell wall biosynthesis
MTGERISVVIPTRNRAESIGAAVGSVLANSGPLLEVLVLDQSDGNETGSIVREMAVRDARLRYHHTPIAGLSRAYNIGIRETRGEIVAFTDDDCVARTDWTASIATGLANAPDADMLYGQVLLPAGLERRPGDVIPTLAISEPRRFGPGLPFRIYGMGANFAARRRLFERVGLFDELLGGGAPLRSSQDFDLQFRAYRAGAIVVLAPDVVVEHYGLRTAKQWPATLVAYGFGDGAFYFKHVRCGDMYALGLLARRLVRLSIRELANGIRRRPSMAAYLGACIAGIRESAGYPIDRRARLYLAKPGVVAT